MDIVHSEEEHSSRGVSENKVVIGLVFKDKELCIAVRMKGKEVLQRNFILNKEGTAAMLKYLEKWHSTLRVAIARAGDSALNLALAVGAQRHNREVFIVSIDAGCSASELARSAEHFK